MDEVYAAAVGACLVQGEATSAACNQASPQSRPIINASWLISCQPKYF